MSYQALYRKWRPQVFEDVVGQKHITETLKHEIHADRIAHAYLFCGTRGTGKTSTAKIFSRAINCINNQDGNPCNTCEVCRGISDGSIMDVVEIDAASNNGVDNIREIRDEVAYAPSRGKYKVYIIDEVHMLSTGAFNALLKTLEEPPAHVIFILATTESQKIPATILSRCQRFDFRRITTDDIVGRLKEVIGKDGIGVDEKGLRMVAKVADGSMRDALSILDQCIAFGRQDITYEDIISILGVVDNSLLFEMSASIIQGNTARAMELIEQLVIAGMDIVHFIDDLIGHFRNLLLCKVIDNPDSILDMVQESVDELKKQSAGLSQEKIVNHIKMLSDAYATVKWSANPRIILEVTIVKMCSPELDTSVEGLLDRIKDLEQKLASGVVEIMQPAPAGSVEQKAQQSVKQRPVPVKKKRLPDAETGKVINLWPEVINEVKKRGKLSLFGHLADVKVEPVDGALGIVFKDSCATNKMMVDRKENIELLEDAIAKVSGGVLKVKCLLERELQDIDEQADEEDNLEQFIKQKDELGDRVQVYDDE